MNSFTPPPTRRSVLGSLLGATAAVAAACSPAKRRRSPARTSVPSVSTTAPVRRVRIGYVAEITGPNSARGELVKAGLDALAGYIDEKLGGTYHGLTLELIPADVANSVDAAEGAYTDLVSEKVDAVLWCAPFGLVENLPTVLGGGIPLLSVMADVHSYADPAQLALTGAAARGTVVFQTLLPDSTAIDVLMAYASEDRGFATAALLYDTAVYAHVDRLFTGAAGRHNITVNGVFPYDSSTQVDFTGPLSTLKAKGVHAVVCYGLADHVSIIVTRLQSLDAAYVDTPTAKRAGFKPMVMGSRWGTGDPSFVGLAGEAATRGTLTAGALGSVISLPTFPMRDWLRAYRPDYNRGFPRGGEDGPADAAVLVLDAVARAGSTNATDIVAALESGHVTKLASAVGLSFAADRHLAPGRGDAALLSLELPPAPYVLGNEWKDVLPKGYTGTTQLIDFTLLANTTAHGDVVQEILTRRYGTSSSDEFQGADANKVAACRAVH
jgi:ABC-type branched-subunit amino acid transport system substrate-binding protein